MKKQSFRLVFLAIVFSLILLPKAVLANPPDPEIVKKFSPGKEWKGEQPAYSTSGAPLGKRDVVMVVSESGEVKVNITELVITNLSRKNEIPPRAIKAEGSFGFDGEGRPKFTLPTKDVEYCFYLIENGGAVLFDGYSPIYWLKFEKTFLR